MGSSMRELEEKLFAQYPVTGKEQPVFIVGAPRTGTTLVYQLLCRHFEVTYLSNLVNDHFPSRPALGYCVQETAAHAVEDHITLWASYGRAPGPYQPSECSEVFKRWFTDTHPSQTTSAAFISDERKLHMQNTIAAVAGLSGNKPIIIKNAWNCFRVWALHKAFPGIKLLWVRRDIRKAAASDLISRLVVKRDPYAWNAATPANLAVLEEKHYIAQAVENQYEYNKALDGLVTNNVWYEDLVKGSTNESAFAYRLGIKLLSKLPPLAFKDDPRYRLDKADRQALERYISEHEERLEPYFYDKSQPRF